MERKVSSRLRCCFQPFLPVHEAVSPVPVRTVAKGMFLKKCDFALMLAFLPEGAMSCSLAAVKSLVM